MLETRSLVIPAQLEPEDFFQVLLGLSESGWSPALLESQRAFMNMAGETDIRLLPSLKTSEMIRRRTPYDAGGDIFFHERDVYYIVETASEIAIAIDPSGRAIYREEGRQPTLEVGIITPESNEVEGRLRQFAEAVEKAIKIKVDGRKTRHTSFEWSEKKPGTPRLDKLTSEAEKGTEKYFTRATCQNEEVIAAKLLMNKLARDTLIEISQAGFARQRDIFSRKTKQQADLQATIVNLSQAGLLYVEYLLECKQTGAPLTRLKDLEQLKLLEVGSLLCGACGSEFRNENVNEGYSLTDLGRKLIRQSHWMTVWITEILAQAGIPESNILWNLAETGEEVDLLVEFMNQLWIFELKDREFGAGDAHPLNYRQVRYRANNSIVITTEQVSKDAKRVFTDLARESQSQLRRSVGREPIYVEGLDSASVILKREVSRAALQYAVRRLNVLGELSGYDLSILLNAKYGEQVGSDLQGED